MLLDQPEWFKVLLLALATFLSEDLTCVGAGILAGAGDLLWPTALIGCYVGVVLGDGLLWLLGHSLGRRALLLPVVRTLVPEEKLARAERWFAENGMRVILLSRCLPGSRFATYLCAGILGARARNFLLLSSTAASIWTPLVVWLSSKFGNALGGLFGRMGEHPFWSVVASLCIMLGALHLLGLLSSRRERALFRARWARRRRWEFLPRWLWQFPVGLYALALAVRHHGLRLPLLINPQAGPLPGARTPRPAGTGRRYEVVFARLPEETRARILSIAERARPEVTGNGTRTLEELVLRHPRLRLWAPAFLHALGGRVTEVPPAGERVPLAGALPFPAGTTVRSRPELATPALLTRLESWIRDLPGSFHLLRFDLEAPGEEDLRAGRDLRLVRILGASGEPTHIFDPRRSLFAAWRDLCRHWRLGFRIAAANRSAGARPPSYRKILQMFRFSRLAP